MRYRAGKRLGGSRTVKRRVSKFANRLATGRVCRLRKFPGILLGYGGPCTTVIAITNYRYVLIRSNVRFK